jgi:hypothetical protein
VCAAGSIMWGSVLAEDTPHLPMLIGKQRSIARPGADVQKQSRCPELNSIDFCTHSLRVYGDSGQNNESDIDRESHHLSKGWVQERDGGEPGNSHLQEY